MKRISLLVGALTQSLATLGFLFFTSAAAADALVLIRLEVDDTSGNPISSISAGESFELKLFAQDLQSPVPVGGGVFAAYANIAYDAALVSLGGPLQPGPGFSTAAWTDTSTPGTILHAGGFSSLPSGPGDNSEALIVSIPFNANSVGVNSFLPTFDTNSLGAIYLFDNNTPLGSGEISYAGATLAVVPEPASVTLAALACLALTACAWCRRR